MGKAIASQITSFTIVYWAVYSDANQRKYQSSPSLAFVWGIHRRPVNSPHKWPVTRKMFSFDDVIMQLSGMYDLHLNGPRWDIYTFLSDLDTITVELLWITSEYDNFCSWTHQLNDDDSFIMIQQFELLPNHLISHVYVSNWICYHHLLIFWCIHTGVWPVRMNSFLGLFEIDTCKTNNKRIPKLYFPFCHFLSPETC